MGRLYLALAVLLALAGAGYAYTSAVSEAALQAQKAASWKAAHDSLVEERELWDELLTDNERALERVEQRRRRAEDKYQQALLDLAKARRWAAGGVPGAVADSLCLRAGSCARREDDTGDAAGAGGGAAAGAGASWRLTNNSLRRGLEDCRAALGRANGKIDAIRRWNEAKKPKRQSATHGRGNGITE